MRRWGRHKFGAQRAEADGRSFASKLERAVYELLKLRLAAGEITEIKCQVQVSLTKAGVIYRPDFQCFTAGGGSFYVEAKGVETPEYRLKRRLWTVYGPGILMVYKGSYAKPVLHETITPRGEE